MELNISWYAIHIPYVHLYGISLSIIKSQKVYIEVYFSDLSGLMGMFFFYFCRYEGFFIFGGGYFIKGGSAFFVQLLVEQCCFYNKILC